MKKILLLLLLAVPLSAGADSLTSIGNARFGESYNPALEKLKTEFGAPVAVSTDCVTFKDLTYHNVKFSHVDFYFKNQKLNGASFVVAVANKRLAISKVKQIRDSLSEQYDISQDYDDGAYFYIGGHSPRGIGRLFTISSGKRNGGWFAELRYGPF